MGSSPLTLTVPVFLILKETVKSVLSKLLLPAIELTAPPFLFIAIAKLVISKSGKAKEGQSSVSKGAWLKNILKGLF